MADSQALMVGFSSIFDHDTDIAPRAPG